MSNFTRMQQAASDTGDPGEGAAAAADIIIHLDAYHRRAVSLQSEKKEAEEAYQTHIAAYLAFLKEEATAAGYGLVLDKHETEVAVTYGGTRAQQQAAHDWLQTLPDFWNWIP